MKNHEESSSDEEDPRLKEALDPHMFSNETTAVEKRGNFINKNTVLCVIDECNLKNFNCRTWRLESRSLQG